MRGTGEAGHAHMREQHLRHREQQAQRPCYNNAFRVFPSMSSVASAYRIDSRIEWDEVTTGASGSRGVKAAPG